MNEPQRFEKPNMTNLPPELGRAIFEQILHTPKPDFERMNAEARKLEKEMLRMLEEEDKNSKTGTGQNLS